VKRSSINIPPVVKDFPGATEAYLKLLNTFGDNRIVRVVRSKGNVAKELTQAQYFQNRAMHLGAQSAALVSTLPVTLFEFVGANQIHFEPGQVFQMNALYFGDRQSNIKTQPQE
jgi:hypothetical protein